MGLNNLIMVCAMVILFALCIYYAIIEIMNDVSEDNARTQECKELCNAAHMWVDAKYIDFCVCKNHNKSQCIWRPPKDDN